VALPEKRARMKASCTAGGGSPGVARNSGTTNALAFSAEENEGPAASYLERGARRQGNFLLDSSTRVRAFHEQRAGRGRAPPLSHLLSNAHAANLELLGERPPAPGDSGLYGCELRALFATAGAMVQNPERFALS